MIGIIIATSLTVVGLILAFAYRSDRVIDFFRHSTILPWSRPPLSVWIKGDEHFLLICMQNVSRTIQDYIYVYCENVEIDGIHDKLRPYMTRHKANDYSCDDLRPKSEKYTLVPRQYVEVLFVPTCLPVAPWKSENVYWDYIYDALQKGSLFFVSTMDGQQIPPKNWSKLSKKLQQKVGYHISKSKRSCLIESGRQITGDNNAN